MTVNPYLEEIKINIPRLLSLFDTDSTSASYGFGDRYHWAWGLSDFSNGTFQGAAHGLARLWTAGLWPYSTSQSSFITRVHSLFSATKRLIRPDGSLEEAFPYEGSYCVTALVAFDLLCTVDLLQDTISSKRRQQWISCITPLINFLVISDETHALISNHLATAAAALFRWHSLTGESAANHKASILLSRILSNQSSEGWFREYQGADPGYQSLCTYYLADIHQNRPDLDLLSPLCASIKFLIHCVHPDGSFGGLYGSRCTRFYVPAGILALSTQIPQAAILASFMEKSISEQRTVTLSAMDESNLIPMFNSYAWAATQWQAQKKPISHPIPAESPTPFRIWYRDAGLLIDRGVSHYTIINVHKGGVVYHYRNHDNTPHIDAGVVVSNPCGSLGSTQAYDSNNMTVLGPETIRITTCITAMPKQLPNPLQLTILRILSMTIFKNSSLRELSKQFLVRLLITKRNQWPVQNIRTIHLGHSLSVSDTTALKHGYSIYTPLDTFVSIHMASQGYWQIQDEK